MSWLDDLAASFPQLQWDMRRRTSYLESVAKFQPGSVSAVVESIRTGGWDDDFPPVPSRLASMVRSHESGERVERAREEHRELERARDDRTAPPWHPPLWLAWRLLAGGHEVPDHLAPYARIVQETGLEPELAGVSYSPVMMGLVWDRAAVASAYHEAVDRAEVVWRQAGVTETAEEAALRAIAALRSDMGVSA